MGYPYPFDELTVVDLPSEDRHALYRDESRPDTVETPQGLVTYRYHSMTDLRSYPSGSFDLVYSGQSIEHVTRRQAGGVLSQVRRVLRPGGILALDTPNRRLTRLQQDAFIDPDHKYEYSHPELAAMLRGTGFVIERAVGMSPEGVRRPGPLRRRGARHQARRLRRDRGLLPAGLRVPTPDRRRAHDGGAAGPMAGGGSGGVRAARRRAARRLAGRGAPPSAG